ncbi:MAG: AbgT family transporter, partial [Rheinheimera sp.]|nr:AbgT family transporter [Rheinheimera sp.]
EPERSLSFHSDQKLRAAHSAQAQSQYSQLDSLILLSFFAGLVWIIWGVTARQYYIPEIASQFFTIGVVIAIIAVLGKRMSMNDAAEGFKQGAAELLPAALIVGMAKGIVLLLGGDNPESPSVLNTLLYYSGQLLGDLPAYLSAWLMLVIQSVINFFVASGSGQAALTMPLIAPLADLVGLSRQIAVLAFQLGDGLTNCIIPTSASLIGCLGVVRVDWSVWFRFVWRLQLWLFAIASAFVLLAVSIGYQ